LAQLLRLRVRTFSARLLIRIIFTVCRCPSF